MVGYNLLLILCVTLVMCFQVNFYFNSVFDKSSRKPDRTVYFIIFGVLDSLYLGMQMSSAVSSIVAFLVIFSLAQSYRVELKSKIIFSILYGVLMTITNFLSLYILDALESIDFSTFDPLNGQNDLLFSKVMLLSCSIMFAVIQIIRLIAKRRSFSVHYRYYLLFLIVPTITIYR